MTTLAAKLMQELGLGPSQMNGANFEYARIALHDAFFKGMEEAENTPLMPLTVEMKSTGESEEYIMLEHLPVMTEWKGDRRLTTVGEGKFRVANKDFANGLIMGKNEVDDNKWVNYLARAKDLGQAAKWRAQESLANLLKASMPGSTETCYDGSPLIHSAHTFFNGPAQSNHLGAVAFSEANLEAAFTALSKVKTWDGLRTLHRRGTHLVVGPDNAALAAKLLAPINGTGGQNPFLVSKGCQVIVCDELAVGGTSGWWFLADLRNEASRPLLFQDREAVQWAADDSELFSKKIYKFGAHTRFGVGLNDWTSIVGANP